jgi:hypothetical protein
MIDEKLMEFATPQQLKYIIAIETNGSHRKAAAALGVHPSSIDRAMKSLVQKAATMGYSPDHHMTRSIAPGLKLRGTSQLFKAGQAEPALEWIKTSVDEEARERMLQERITALCEELPVLSPVERVEENVSQDLLNLYTFTDYHMGMLAWHKEGGSDWDLKISEQILWDAFRKMVDAAPKAHTCVLNIQGDFLHSDGLLPVTPAHKHVLDQDGRFSKIVDVAIRVLRRLVAHALAKHEHVHLLIVEGNHDESSSIWLRRAFAAMYEEEPRLTVNDSELPYYVYQHGEVMLAFHHGHKMKNEQMPGLFAAQFSKMWGATEKRYCHTGHRHHLDEKEYSGMTVTQHPTLSARDAYAARGGWIAERAALAITYHQKAGQYARTYITPELLN